ncbi:hypothetical protein PAHAL_3G068700 [Panicum hallii]|uniref:Dirigent protein n=1 Tax=Panicum hallii TaxID=206008 RepID=A0A2T8KHH6_9POAL|nr:dirigent protein 21-like [Panicum hallii]PVH61582.1 hypothetical protein PAHAL_3G068700 [Panicum hallii]
MATTYFTIAPCQYVLCQNEVTMKLYLHQVVQGQPNQNQVAMVPSLQPAGFGTIAVNDWTVIDGPNPSANIVGRAKGVHIQADQANAGWYTSLLIIFEGGRFKGSSLQALGITASTGELAIIGGTGEFKMARGTIKYKIVLNTPNVESIRELNIQAFYTPEIPPAAQGAVTIVNAAGQAPN